MPFVLNQNSPKRTLTTLYVTIRGIYLELLLYRECPASNFSGLAAQLRSWGFISCSSIAMTLKIFAWLEENFILSKVAYTCTFMRQVEQVLSMVFYRRGNGGCEGKLPVQGHSVK